MTKAIVTLGTGGKHVLLINDNELKQSNFWNLDNQWRSCFWKTAFWQYLHLRAVFVSQPIRTGLICMTELLPLKFNLSPHHCCLKSTVHTHQNLAWNLLSVLLPEVMTHKHFFFLAQRVLWHLSNGIFPQDSESHKWGLGVSRDAPCCGTGWCQAFLWSSFSQQTRTHCTPSALPQCLPSFHLQFTANLPQTVAQK